MELRGAICLVTGGSSGIGRATTIALVRSGARVVALGRDEQALAEVAAETSAVAVRADLADRAGVARAVGEAIDAFGLIDVLVNNAGEGWAGLLAEQDPERLAHLVDVNLLAPVLLTRALLPGMLERRRGHVVNVASIAGHVGVAGEAVYAATKAGLVGFSESLRFELRGSGIGVSVVSPGAVATRFFERRGRPYDRAFPRPIRSDRVARAVLRAIEHDRPQVFAPRWMAFPAWLRGATPSLYRALAGRFG